MKLAKIYCFAILILSIILSAISCKKEKQEAPTVPLSYTSLMLQNDTIFVGTTTIITANATGDNLTYSWKLETGSLGDIIGAGATISYGASPCCTGWNTIICTVSDGSASAEKSVTIVVMEP